MNPRSCVFLTCISTQVDWLLEKVDDFYSASTIAGAKEGFGFFFPLKSFLQMGKTIIHGECIDWKVVSKLIHNQRG